MLRRVEGEAHRPASLGELLGLQRSAPVVPAIPEAEMESSLLPRDHPPWVKDALTVSQRAREAIARLKPVVIRILTFWDHRWRARIVGGSRVSIDASGSYRVE
ncbi:MAG: hypothetical protein KGN02_14670 [bacterium]|nr:hypothetical protein [bacterium]